MTTDHTEATDHTDRPDRTDRSRARQLSLGNLRTTRMEAFSDGVFAIAITLLVLEIKVPDAPQRIGHDLIDLWPSYVAYVTSFMTIGAMWLLHTAITDHLKRADTVLLRINLPLLLFVAFLPFPSKLLGESINVPEEARIVAPFYGITLLVIGLLVLALWAYCRQADLLREDTPAEVVGMMSRQLRVGVVFYAVAVAIGVLIPRLAVLLYLGIAVFVMVPSVTAYREARAASRT